MTCAYMAPSIVIMYSSVCGSSSAARSPGPLTCRSATATARARRSVSAQLAVMCAPDGSAE